MTLIDSLGIAGGGERLAMELTKQLDPIRFERTLCVSRWSDERADDPAGVAAQAGLREAGVMLLGLRRTSVASVRPWAQLRRHLQEKRIDVLHAHKFGSNAWGTMVGRWSGVPVIVAHEHSWSYEDWTTRKLLDRHLIGRFADAFVAVSREDRRRMVEIERVPAEKTRFIPSGMPPVPQLGPPEDLRRELGLTDEPVVGSVGTLRPEKALGDLVRATALLVRGAPRLKVLIAGGGDKAPLEALVDDLGLREHVLLLGPRTDISSFLRVLDVAVNCSLREGSSLSIMEYMDAGLPVVATRVGGSPDLIEDGITGTLVEPRDPEALSAAIAMLLANPGRAREMGDLGRRRRRSQFDLETMARAVEGLYDELLPGRARKPERRP